MKRTTAFWLTFALLLLLGAYALWGLRPFLLRPGLSFDKRIPNEARAAAIRWHETSAFLGSEPFRWKRYLDMLCHPYQTASTPITVKWNGDKTLTATQQSTHSPGFVQITRKSKDWSSTRVDEVTWKSIHLMENKITDRQKRIMDVPIPDAIPTD